VPESTPALFPAKLTERTLDGKYLSYEVIAFEEDKK
jgi:hypothetical protein